MKISLLDEFEWLSASILEGDASREEIDRFNDLIRDYPDLVQVYLEQLQMHVLLECRGGSLDGIKPERNSIPARKQQNVSDRATARRSWWKMAAAAALLMTGTAMWYAASHFSTGKRFETELDVQRNPVVPAISLIGQKGIRGFDLPETLPGTLRLESGEVVVRLQTGVKLILIGPAEVHVENGLRVVLDRGKLLASVPHWAVGFTVRTRELEIYDLGTVFGVQVDKDVSDVFVFQGSVQVNEAGHNEWSSQVSGAGVGVCEAGEGVRAVSGGTPAKIAADWPEAQALFGAVQAGRALNEPSQSMKTASEIADLWAERYMPGSNLVTPKIRVGNGIPFRKTAWVRASAPQQEVTEMNRAGAAAMMTAAAVAMSSGTAGALSTPVQINFSPHMDRLWSTVFTNEVPLRWDWTSAATCAELEITGMNSSFSTNFTSVTSNYVWRIFTGGIPSGEDAYDVHLTFYDANKESVGMLSSKLSVVKGAFGETVVDPGPSGRKWTTVRRSAVIPYDASWTAATDGAAAGRLAIAKIGGVPQTNSLSNASGYFGWKLANSGWGYGTFNLALTFPDTEGVWDATLAYVPCGILILMK